MSGNKKLSSMIKPLFFVCKLLVSLTVATTIIVSIVRWYHSYESKQRLFVDYNHKCWIVDGNASFTGIGGRSVLEFRGAKLNMPYSETDWFKTDSAEEMSNALKLSNINESVCETDVK